MMRATGRRATGWLWVVGCALASAVGCGSSDQPGAPPGTGGTGGVTHACTGSGECAPPVPYCEPGGGVCVECLGDPNCTSGRKCNPATFACVRCLSDAHCGGPQPYCSPTTNDCVACTTNTHCGGGTQVCDVATGHCVAGCTSSGDCNAATGKPYCDTSHSLCVQCLGDGNCSGPRPYCLPAEFTCVECLADTNCQHNDKCRPSDHTCHGG